MSVVMAAPNGGRRGKADHEALPLTVAEIVATAVECAEAGADAIHLHVRTDSGGPSLDPGLYREAIQGVRDALGDRLIIQASTETFGGFAPQDVERLLKEVRPDAASIALIDIAPEQEDDGRAGSLFGWARDEGVGLQHIVYRPQEIERLAGLLPADEPLAFLFVLGRYEKEVPSDPLRLIDFLNALDVAGLRERAEWMFCAFGQPETRCAAAAGALGGHSRIGFENNFFHADGGRAEKNADRVKAVRQILDRIGLERPERAKTRRVLGMR